MVSEIANRPVTRQAFHGASASNAIRTTITSARIPVFQNRTLNIKPNSPSEQSQLLTCCHYKEIAMGSHIITGVLKI